MDEKRLVGLLNDVKEGRIAVGKAVDAMRQWPVEMLGFARIDNHRRIRTGFPEVVFGENKSAGQIAEILARLADGGGVAVATRVSPEKGAAVRERLPAFAYHDEARMLVSAVPEPDSACYRGTVVVLTAGTSDIPVAEEAALTVRCHGQPVETAFDVGVAGIHRLLEKRELIEAASVLVVVAGMEGALPSVVAGLVSRPVVAVPTSVGYGTGFGGIAALLGMLNSCAPGVAVVNIDNGFGAGCMAAAINRRHNGGSGCV
jgi:NCAIR mutase (PurE)-related protein